MPVVVKHARRASWLLATTALTLLALTSACPLPQPEVCAQYVRCQEAVDDSVDTSPWQEDGSCWALPDSARRCEGQCRAALEALQALPDPPEVCAPISGEPV